MKTKNKILLGMAVVAVTGLVVYAYTHRKKSKHMASKVSDEGYETAHDILFPGKEKKDSKLRYGPILPS
jgi:hypothetical protein